MKPFVPDCSLRITQKFGSCHNSGHFALDSSNYGTIIEEWSCSWGMFAFVNYNSDFDKMFIYALN